MVLGVTGQLSGSTNSSLSYTYTVSFLVVSEIDSCKKEAAGGYKIFTIWLALFLPLSPLCLLCSHLNFAPPSVLPQIHETSGISSFSFDESGFYASRGKTSLWIMIFWSPMNFMYQKYEKASQKLDLDLKEPYKTECKLTKRSTNSGLWSG